MLDGAAGGGRDGLTFILPAGEGIVWAVGEAVQ